MWPNLKQKVRAVHPKPKLIVYIGRFHKFYEPDPDPRNSPKRKKIVLKAPKKV